VHVSYVAPLLAFLRAWKVGADAIRQSASDELSVVRSAHFHCPTFWERAEMESYSLGSWHADKARETAAGQGQSVLPPTSSGSAQIRARNIPIPTAIVMEQEHSFVRSVRFNIKVPERGRQLDVCRRGHVDDESLILIRPRRGRERAPLPSVMHVADWRFERNAPRMSSLMSRLLRAAKAAIQRQNTRFGSQAMPIRAYPETATFPLS
jgi:hypothetical protein